MSGRGEGEGGGGGGKKQSRMTWSALTGVGDMGEWRKCGMWVRGEATRGGGVWGLGGEVIRYKGAPGVERRQHVGVQRRSIIV